MALRIIVSKKGYTARSFSFFGIQRIYVGERYQALKPFARRAVIAHECAHLAGHHTEWRILALLVPLCWPFLSRLFHWQEYRADACAAATGHLHGLLYILQRQNINSFTHPKNMDRRNKLLHTPQHSSDDRKPSR